MEKPYGFWLHALDDSIALWKAKDDTEMAAILEDLRKELVSNRNAVILQEQRDMESWTND